MHQIAGSVISNVSHAQSGTFLKHYSSSNMVVDVQATFLGTASRTGLIKEIEKLGLRRDPNLPKRLSDHQRTQVHQHPDVIRAQKEKVALAQKFRDSFGSIKDGSKSPKGIQHTEIANSADRDVGLESVLENPKVTNGNLFLVT